MEKLATLVLGGEDNCKILQNGLVKEGTAYLQRLQQKKSFANRFYKVCLPHELVSIRTIIFARSAVEPYLGKKFDYEGLKKLCFRDPSIEVQFYDCDVAILKIKFVEDRAYVTCAFAEEIVLGTLKDSFAKAKITRYRTEPAFFGKLNGMKVN